MKLKSRIMRSFFFASCLACSVLALADVPSNVPSGATLIQQMVGTWKVQQRMWPGPDADARVLSSAIAHRTLVAGGFLEEVMEPASNVDDDNPFKRIAYFNYNTVNRQFEYFSLDSRAPQMMNERSAPTDKQTHPGKGGIALKGGSFVAPQWGEARNVAFTYRLTVGAVDNDKQVVTLYLKPQAGESRQEFTAFEYVYTRER
jgi:hypothetical protein